jgi:predicted dehydrogenase
MIRFGMCGCGRFIREAVLPMMSRVENLQVLAAYDSSRAALESTCQAFQIEHRCNSFEELLAIPEIDVIYVASPNVFHKEQVIQAARAGKHIFCQKPMGMDAAECCAMLSACQENQVNIGIGFCYRFQGAQQLAKEMIHRGEIGDVSNIHFSFNLGGFTRESVGWRCEKKLSGGGPLMDIAPHIIDLACFWLDDQVQSVMAYVRDGETEDDVETDANVLLQFSKGVVASFDTSFLRRNEHHYSITGTLGEIRAAGTMPWFTDGKMALFRDGKTEEVPFSRVEHIEKEMRLFCEAIEQGTDLPVPGEAGLHVQEVIDAIYTSGRTGSCVAVSG